MCFGPGVGSGQGGGWSDSSSGPLGGAGDTGPLPGLSTWYDIGVSGKESVMRKPYYIIPGNDDTTMLVSPLPMARNFGLGTRARLPLARM